jgi:hypothetical protein
MFCSECGENNENDAQFCTSCGSKLSYILSPAQKMNETGIVSGQGQKISPPPTSQIGTKKEETGFFSLERKGINKGVYGGCIMVTVAVIWFFGALALGWIFFYPPILGAIGAYAIIKGLATGNIDGKIDEK